MAIPVLECTVGVLRQIVRTKEPAYLYWDNDAPEDEPMLVDFATARYMLKMHDDFNVPESSGGQNARSKTKPWRGKAKGKARGKTRGKTNKEYFEQSRKQFKEYKAATASHIAVKQTLRGLR